MKAFNCGCIINTYTNKYFAKCISCIDKNISDCSCFDCSDKHLYNNQSNFLSCGCFFQFKFLLKCSFCVNKDYDNCLCDSCNKKKI